MIHDQHHVDERTQSLTHSAILQR